MFIFVYHLKPLHHMYKDLNNETQFKPLDDFEGLSLEQIRANAHEMNIIRAGIMGTLASRVSAAKDDLEMILIYLETGNLESIRKVAERSLDRCEHVIAQADAEYANICGKPLIKIL